MDKPPPDIDKSIEAILSGHKAPPRILSKGGQPLTTGEQKAQLVRGAMYQRLEGMLSDI